MVYPCRTFPEPPVNPVEDDSTYERNVRNELRDDVCAAIDLIDSRLGELDEKDFGGYLRSLAHLREEMRLGIEG